jgi:hypothetical protein
MSSTIVTPSPCARQSPQDKPGTWADLPADWRRRLAGYGIHSPADWRQLSPSKRGRLFGVTGRMVTMFDALAGKRS